MATYKKISGMDAAGALDGTETLEAVQSGDTVKATATQVQTFILPPGFILPYGGASAPSGYLACGGSAVSRTTYAALFTAIGTTWGVGDGSTTFNVPNLNGAVLRGTGTGTINARDKVGPAVGAYQEDQMQGHRHTFTGSPNAGGTTYRPSVGQYNATNTTDGTEVAPITDGTNGTPRTGAESRAYAAGVLYCIKT